MQGDADVGADPGLGYLTAGNREIDELRRVDQDVVALAFLLVRTVAEYAIEDLHGHRNESGVGDPGTVEAVTGLPLLVLPHLGEGDLIDLRVTPRGDEGRHAADGVGPAMVAGLDQELGVGAHEWHGHRDLRPVRSASPLRRGTS